MIEAEGITKRYGLVVANDAITGQFVAGKVYALLGENGAGKSTFVKMMAGLEKPDAGNFALDGQEVHFRDRHTAREAGIGIVQQHPKLFEAMTVAENFFLDEDGPVWAGPDAGFGARLAQEAKLFGVQIDPERPVWQLSYSQKRWLEILKLGRSGSSIMILDEATYALSPQESGAVLGRMRRFAQEGRVVIMVTHRLAEVLEYADEVLVLYRGKMVARRPVAGCNAGMLAALMLNQGGSPVVAGKQDSAIVLGEVVAELRGVSVRDVRGGYALRDISFSISRGEVVGVAGMSGGGQVELARLVAGLEDKFEGEVSVANTPDASADRPATIRYIPEDRFGVGAPPALSVRDNLVLRDYRDAPASYHGFVNDVLLDKLAGKRRKDMGIVLNDLQQSTGELSGGNVQRLIVARELSGKVDLLIAHNPTAGLDQASRRHVQSLIRATASAGCATLLISEDLDELLELSSKIVVLRDGKMAGTMGRPEFDLIRIGMLMSGGECK